MATAQHNVSALDEAIDDQSVAVADEATGDQSVVALEQEIGEQNGALSQMVLIWVRVSLYIVS